MRSTVAPSERALAGFGLLAAAVLAPAAPAATPDLAVAAGTAAAAGTATTTTTTLATTRSISYHSWSGAPAFRTGALYGLQAGPAGLRLGRPVGRLAFTDPATGVTRRYDYGRWVSPWVRPGFALTQLVPSWEASTHRGSWIQVDVRGIDRAGRWSSWDTIADWAYGDTTIHRTSLGAQTDDLAKVATDTWVGQDGHQFRAWRLRVSLFRRTGTTVTPYVRTVGAMASKVPSTDTSPTSPPGVARGIVLDVPGYSQMLHRGEYPTYGGGGEAWCSPTSTSMVLAYYRRLPAPREYAWVNPSYRDRFVDHAARMTYDHRYEGTGNWPFNTAYAAAHADHAFVTRLRSLAEAERFVEAGIPLVVSISFSAGALQGAPLSSTDGHLVVIVGFTATGDVVVNDPAARYDNRVRRTYRRGQFEAAWLTGSGGLAYVIRDDDHPLPARAGNTNW